MCIVARMDRIYRETLLFDFYGELLTEHQRNIYEEVVFEDCSLGEVAERHKVSRQSVHDIVRRSRKTLEGYEEKLGLVEKFLHFKERINTIKTLTDDERIRKLADEMLEEL